MLTKQHRQEALSRAYVQAIAARAGLSLTWRTTDYGIDLSLNEIKQRGRRKVEAGVQLDIQLKSTTTAHVTETEVFHDLEVKSFDDLRDGEVLVPRVLVVVVLPQDEQLWVTVSEEQLILRHAAYWLSLVGRQPVRRRKSIRLALPRANLLTVEGVQHLLVRASKGEIL